MNRKKKIKALIQFELSVGDLHDAHFRERGNEKTALEIYIKALLRLLKILLKRKPTSKEINEVILGKGNIP